MTELMKRMKFEFGREYKSVYAKKSAKPFKLIGLGVCSFHFACGHKCTDNVFSDFYDVKTGVRVTEFQTELFV